MKVWKGQMMANQWSAFTVFHQELTLWPHWMTLRPKVTSPGVRGQLLRCWPERRCHGDNTSRRMARWGVQEERARCGCAERSKLHSEAAAEHFSRWGYSLANCKVLKKKKKMPMNPSIKSVLKTLVTLSINSVSVTHYEHIMNTLIMHYRWLGLGL